MSPVSRMDAWWAHGGWLQKEAEQQQGGAPKTTAARLRIQRGGLRCCAATVTAVDDDDDGDDDCDVGLMTHHRVGGVHAHVCAYPGLWADISELNLPERVCKIDFPVADDLLNFFLDVRPEDGFYRGATYRFSFKVGTNYPHEPPKVKCLNKVCECSSV